jgi:hypothetical protein
MFGTKAKPGQPIDWIIVKVREGIFTPTRLSFEKINTEDSLILNPGVDCI